MVAAAGMTGGLAKSPGELARRAVDGLGASGPIEDLVGSVRGELTSAAKNAATAAASRRIDALTERLSGSLSADKNGADQERPDESDESDESEEPDESEHSDEHEDEEEQ